MSENKEKKKYVTKDTQYMFTKTGLGSIVPAEYIHKKGKSEGNIFCEALPEPLSPEERRNWFNKTIKSLSQEELENMSLSEKIDDLEKIDDIRVQLPQDEALDVYLYKMLNESYQNRKEIKSETNCLELLVGNTIVHQRTRMVPEHISDPTNGIAMIGVGGTGKSQALNRVLERYPQVIIHEREDGSQTVQIVYLIVTLHANSSFKAFWTEVAYAIENALGHLNLQYTDEIRKKGPDVQFNMIVELISMFNIGTIFVDEIQLINKISAKRGQGINYFLNLQNSTRIGMGICGTREAYEKLFDDPHTARRFPHVIIAEKYISSRPLFDYNMKMLMKAQWTPIKMKYTKEIGDYIYDKTEGIIGFMKLFWMNVQMNAIIKGTKEITFEDIKNTGEKNMKHMNNALYLNDLNMEDTSFSQALNYLRSLNVKSKDEPSKVLDSKFSLQQEVVSSIQDVRDDLSEFGIKRAFDIAWSQNGKNMKTVRKAVRATMDVIRKMEASDNKTDASQPDYEESSFTEEDTEKETKKIKKEKGSDQNELRQLQEMLGKSDSELLSSFK